MFKWFYYWKLGRKTKKNLKKQCEWTKSLGPATPPTLEEVKKFIAEMGGNLDARCVDRLPPNKAQHIDRNI